MSLAVLLFVIFLVLKLAGLVTWGWLWVTAPLWIPLAVSLVLAALGITAVGSAQAAQRRRMRR